MLLVVGAVFVSLIRFYVGFGEMAADLGSREPLPEDRREMGRYFMETFFLKGSIPSVMFWGGLLVALFGVGRNLARALARRPK
jgi:hypothetical protein